MSPDLHRLIEEYVGVVARRFEQLQRETGVAIPKSDIEWAINGLKKGVLSDGATFQKHGVGCLIEFREGSVDFDVGVLGELNGFDAWRLAEFERTSSSRYGPLAEKQLQTQLDDSLASGEIERRGRLYYLRNDPPNQALQATPTAVTPAAGAPGAPSAGVPEL